MLLINPRPRRRCSASIRAHGPRGGRLGARVPNACPSGSSPLSSSFHPPSSSHTPFDSSAAMSELRYTQTAHLSDGHTKGITCVSFNPDGTLLVTAGLDGVVCVWDTKTWSAVDIYYPKTVFTAVAWFSNSAVICGLQDGVLSCLVKVGEVSSLLQVEFIQH